MQQPKTAWIFDVDGVLADPKEKKVTEEALFHHIIDKLQKEEPVCLNTGRSITWIEERLLQPLLNKIDDKAILAYFIVIGEKGGTWMSIDKDGKTHKAIDHDFSIAKDVQDKVKRLINEKYNGIVDYDPTKETMISIEMRDEYDVHEFAKKQKELNKDLGHILHEAQDEDGYKLDPTIIASDIQNPQAGKALGTKRFLHWLNKKPLHPKKFVAFGDSISDLEMVDELRRQGHNVEFVYVGDPQKLEEAEEEGKIKNKALIRQIGNFTRGTLEYLNK